VNCPNITSVITSGKVSDVWKEALINTPYIKKIEKAAEEKRKAKEKAEKLAKEKRKAEEKAEKERVIFERKSKGLCQHCGGKIKEGFFTSKCTACGREKDY
jgi:hypothetical protein